MTNKSVSNGIWGRSSGTHQIMRIHSPTSGKPSVITKQRRNYFNHLR